LWTVEVHPFVLRAVAAGPGAVDDAFELGQFRSLATLLSGKAGREHLLLCDGLHAVRLDILAGCAARGPVEFRYLIGGLASAEKPLLTLRRLIALQKGGRFSPTLQRREARARRWILALRAFDAVAAGADQRAIASQLLGLAAREPRWRSQAPSLRSQAQRLVRSARLMAAGGYRELLW
jgi:hypothetical protein